MSIFDPDIDSALDFLDSLFDSPNSSDPHHAKRGDVIGVHRVGGLFDHYGIYENDNTIYEYGLHDDKVDIGITTLKEFIKDSNGYFVLGFAETHDTKPKKIHMPAPTLNGCFPKYDNGIPLLDIIENIINIKSSTENYHLYSPDETIARAKSRLGESNYTLVTENCEYYAIWCKTGVDESYQVKGGIELLKHLKETYKRTELLKY